MKYYQDITLLPDTDVSLGFIWEKVYQQIHLMLVEHKVADNESKVGLSFPNYGDKVFPLGNQLRLLASSEEQLSRLDVYKWLQRLTDYVHIKSVKSVPSDVMDYVCFTRWNSKSPQRQIKQVDRRSVYLAEKHGVDVDKMKAELLASIEKKSSYSKLPFINVQSLSTEKDGNKSHKFRLFIQLEQGKTNTGSGNTFTCYGLSSKFSDRQTVVPWF